MSLQTSPLLRSTLAGILGSIVYGGWAMYANSGHGDAIALRSGLVQGSYSLAITFAMTLVSEWLFLAFAVVPGRVFVTAAVVSGVLFTSSYGIHHIVGTPEILMTIVPGYVIGSVYTVVYLLGLQRQERLLSLST